MRGAAIAAVSGVVAYATLVLLLATQVLVAAARPAARRCTVLSWDEVRFYLAVNALVQLVVALLAGTLAERLRWTGGELAVATERAERPSAWRRSDAWRRASPTRSEIRSARLPARSSS